MDFCGKRLACIKNLPAVMTYKTAISYAILLLGCEAFFSTYLRLTIICWHKLLIIQNIDKYMEYVRPLNLPSDRGCEALNVPDSICLVVTKYRVLLCEGSVWQTCINSIITICSKEGKSKLGRRPFYANHEGIELSSDDKIVDFCAFC